METTKVSTLAPGAVKETSDGFFEKILGKYDVALFWPVLLSFVAIILMALAFPEATGKTLVTVRNFLIFNFSWAFLLGVGATLFFCIFLAVSPFGDLKLGKDEDKPEFTFNAWISMLFSCGLGIGFVFYSVAEPITHLYQSSHVIDMGAVGKAAGVPKAIEMTLLDWGIHGWALFALAAWAIAFPAYRLGKPMVVSTGLYGLLGDRCNTSIWGRIADMLGALGTIGGNAAMIGLGVASISFGIQTLFGIELSAFGKTAVMIGLIVMYVISACSGVERGIKYLSLINMALAGCVLLALIFFGHAPAQYLFNMMTQMCGDYFSGILEYTFWSDAGNFEQRDWLGWWMVFYWLWWISYIPFCGGFIARISKGRTLREFMFGVIFVPFILTILWFSVWGGSAAFAEVSGALPLWENIQANPESGVYSLLGGMPGGWFISLVVLINIVIFAVTTSDSASFFVAMQMSKGALNPKVSMRLLWGVVIGFTGIIFQLTGGFNAIKSLAIVVGAPFFFVGIAFIFSTYTMLKRAKAGRM
jgi:choline/carnitine/betaine transport